MNKPQATSRGLARATRVYGVTNYVDMVGASRLPALAERLTAQTGERYDPHVLLRELAASGHSLPAEAGKP